MKQILKNDKKISFLSGIRHLFDIGNLFDVYEISNKPYLDDYESLKKDWSIIGSDLKNAMNEFESKYLIHVK